MTIIQRHRHMFHPHQLSYKTPSCEKSTQTLFTATSHSWSKLLDMNILLKNIIYANRLYVACCLYTVLQNSTILFRSYKRGAWYEHRDYHHTVSSSLPIIQEMQAQKVIYTSVLNCSLCSSKIHIEPFAAHRLLPGSGYSQNF